MRWFSTSTNFMNFTVAATSPPQNPVSPKRHQIHTKSTPFKTIVTPAKARIPHSCCFPFPQPIPSKLRCSKKNAIYRPDITPFSAATPKPFITEISNPTPNGCSESNLKKTTSNQAIEAGS